MKKLTIDEINNFNPTMGNPLTVESLSEEIKPEWRRVQIISSVDSAGEVAVSTLNGALLSFNALKMVEHYLPSDRHKVIKKAQLKELKRPVFKPRKIPSRKTSYQTDMPCLACGTLKRQRCFHHVAPRGRAQREIDEHWNLMPVCQQHHNEVHESLVKFASKYPQVFEWLVNNGWEICPVRHRWTHPGLEGL